MASLRLLREASPARRDAVTLIVPSAATVSDAANETALLALARDAATFVPVGVPVTWPQVFTAGPGGTAVQVSGGGNCSRICAGCDATCQRTCDELCIYVVAGGQIHTTARTFTESCCDLSRPDCCAGAC